MVSKRFDTAIINPVLFFHFASGYPVYNPDASRTGGVKMINELT